MDYIKEAEAEEQRRIHGIHISVEGGPVHEIIQQQDVVKFNREIEDWNPNVSYPYGTIVRYMPHRKRHRSNNYDTSYAKRICGYCNVNSLINMFSSSDDPQLSYYEATGKFTNLCAPDDEWVSLINYVFRQPATMLYNIQCACVIVMFFFTINAICEKRSILFNMLHLFINFYIQQKWVFRFW